VLTSWTLGPLADSLVGDSCGLAAVRADNVHSENSWFYNDAMECNPSRAGSEGYGKKKTVVVGETTRATNAASAGSL